MSIVISKIYNFRVETFVHFRNSDEFEDCYLGFNVFYLTLVTRNFHFFYKTFREKD